LDKRRPDIPDPAQRIQGDGAGVAQHDEPLELAGCSVEDATATLHTSPVTHNQVPALNRDPQAIAIERQHAITHLYGYGGLPAT